VRPADVTDIDVAGNDFADVLAGEAAQRHIIDVNVSTQVLYHTFRVNKFQKRFADILISLPHRPKQPKINTFIKPKSDFLNTLIADSPHSVSSSHGRLSCTQCHNSFLKSDPHTIKWLGSPCVPTPFYQIPLKIAPIHIGNLHTHPSHHLCILKGLIFCKRCGFFTQGNTIKALARSCAAPTAHGVAAKKKLFNGELPSNVHMWPDEKPNSTFLSESLVLTKLSRLLDAEEKRIHIQQILAENYEVPDTDSNATPIPSPRSNSNGSD
jgi:hypothetical protein